MGELSCSYLEAALASIIIIKSVDDMQMTRNSPPMEKCVDELKNTDEYMSILDANSPKHEAAVKLQKVYKSFRIRRKLADCAVVIEQSWWKLLDFAELKHSSVSFFDVHKHETAVSRWSRARTRAAKVGKGLSKNGKARKLAIQHWLEAIDPRHRYGHNLHLYYVKWLNSQSKEPFFYWLDIGEGKEVNLVEKCPRSKLQQQCIKYLGPIERKAYEIMMEDGKLIYKQTGELLDTTTQEGKACKWIFVLSTSKILYVGKKKKGSFQHSSFLAGGATLAAGRIVAEKGVLKAVWPHSGHYRPTLENFQDFLSFLRENNVGLTDVKFVPHEDEEDSSGNKSLLYLRSNSSDDNLAEKDHSEPEENENNPNPEQTAPQRVLELASKEPAFQQFIHAIENENSRDSDEESKNEEIIREEHMSTTKMKELKSFQHTSCRWSSGAGPRIGCVRDYPWRLQCHALEQMNLSPRSKHPIELSNLERRSSSSCTSPVCDL
ncbi:calmodulin-binding family protein [Striga hermonthica]|uniref:Calmodulin-binding family protein n=1 Tax=Striga hermonthica TaxID=68872 RepID=A0A9N7NCL2_STRHE|nr:calmodulin-binding family protein [Striga hermonthica]